MWRSRAAESVQGGARQASTTPSGKPAFLAQARAPAKNKEAVLGKGLLGSRALLGKAEPLQGGRTATTGLAALIDGASSDICFQIDCLLRQQSIRHFRRVHGPLRR